MARRSKPDRRQLDVDDVIAGRGRLPTARELIELIRGVNPSGLELPAREMARRYGQKSRLQSLLIRRFESEVEVKPDTGDEGVVGLRYRPLDADACHAVLPELDEDARSWAQRQVDLQVHEAGPVYEMERPRAGRRRSGSESARAAAGVAITDADLSVSELLRAGADAIEAYDYDLARECFLRAFEQAQGGMEAALPLLSLLVDHLAADEEALMLEARLAPAALKQPGVRRLLALAAARSSERDRAEYLLKEDRDPAAADAYIALAQKALGAGALDDAARDLARVRELCPGHAMLEGLARMLQERQAEERRPLEQELARLVAERRLDEAEAHGQGLLARWPDSAPVRKVLREIEELRRAERINELLRSAEEALARGETHARSLMQHALATGLRGEEAARVQKRIAEMDAAERAAAERAQQEQVARLLGENDLAPGLVAYLALDGPQRRRVREQVSLAQLGWLDQIGVTGSGARVRAAVAAVLALDRAARIAGRDPAAALDLIADHAKLLQGIEFCEEVAAQARQRLDALQREQAGRRLEAARDAFGAGEVERARELLAGTPLGHLAERDRTSAGALRARIENTLEMRSIERLQRDGALLRARQAADKLIERLEGPEQSRLEAIRQALGEAIRQAFRVRLDRTPRPCASLRDVAPHWIPNAIRGLLPGSGELVLVETRGVWVFLRMLDLASRTICLHVTLRTPQPLELRNMEIHDGRLLLIGQFGSVLELSLSDWTAVRWHERVGFETDSAPPNGLPDRSKDVAPELFHVERVRDAVMVPHTSWLWFAGYARNRSWVRVADLSRGRVLREFRESSHVRLDTPHELDKPCVVLIRRGEVMLYEPHGSPLEGMRLCCAAFPNGIVVYPGQQKLLLFTGGPEADMDDTDKALPIRWCTLSASGSASPEVALAGDPVSTAMLAAAVDAARGMVFVQTMTEERKRELIGLRACGEGSPGLEPLFRVPMPAHATMIQGWGEQGVRVLVATEQSMEVVPLRAEPPEFGRGPPAGDIWMVHLSLWRIGCHQPAGARNAAAMVLSAALENESRAARLERIQKTEQENDPDRLLELCYALDLCQDHSAAAVLGAWILRQHPSHPEARVAQACRLANRQAWGQVRDMLADTDPSGLDDDRAQHFYHMLGTALVHVGEADEALRVLKKGEACAGGRCELSTMIALCTPLPVLLDDPDEREPWNADQAHIRMLMRAVRAADACLERGDAAGAMCRMDRWDVMYAREVQSMARLAEAYLRGEEAREEARIDKAFALASFCAQHAEQKLLHRRELPLLWGRWDVVKLDEVSARATRWLDTHLGDAWPVPPGGF